MLSDDAYLFCGWDKRREFCELTVIFFNMCQLLAYVACYYNVGNLILKVLGWKLLTMMKDNNENPTSFAMPWDMSAHGCLMTMFFPGNVWK